MGYKGCVVPQCKNTSKYTPHKVFVSVPTNPIRRKMWLRLARRDTNSIGSNSNVFMCEDHFDIEKATLNYMQYKMGFSQKLFLSNEAIPIKFDCQEDRKRRQPVGFSRKAIPKRHKMGLIAESQSGTINHTESLLKDEDMIQDINEPEDTDENIDRLQCLKLTTHLMNKKPLLYVGISKECYFLLIQWLHKNTNIQLEHILLCLKKIRLNSTFSELEDDFGISLSNASQLFLENIPILSNFLRASIVKLEKTLIKKNLPIAFRHNNYHNVSCIIDCLEIDIRKPSKALHQVLTWSEYKKRNTVKYLISCTPNGLVNYVSQGFGGRTSDVTIVENCNFLDGLPHGTCILADRGFKHLEQILHKKGMKLLRPPHVNADAKLSKTDVRQTKIITSLRIPIERVIKRIREFHMLKQHSVINANLVRVLDHVIIIVCALINLNDD